MDAIKKKMQAMKLEKENAMEKSDEMEQKLQEQKDANEKVSVCDVITTVLRHSDGKQPRICTCTWLYS